MQSLTIGENLEQAGGHEQRHQGGPHFLERSNVVQHVFDAHHACQFGDFGPWVFVLLVVAIPLVHRALGRESRIGRAAILAAFELGAKYALAVGAAAATVGIVIGVVTLTGVGFKISFIVTSAAQTIASTVLALLPGGWVDAKSLTLGPHCS